MVHDGMVQALEGMEWDDGASGGVDHDDKVLGDRDQDDEVQDDDRDQDDKDQDDKDQDDKVQDDYRDWYHDE